jgi:high-affinity nickel-transport protein
VAWLYGFIGCLHCLGCGLYLHYARAYPSLVGLGLVAYMFGLRHAFDADHIAAIDDTAGFMLPASTPALSDSHDQAHKHPP